MTYRIRDAILDDAPALADIVIEPTITTFRSRVPDRCLAWLTKDESRANWQKAKRSMAGPTSHAC